MSFSETPLNWVSSSLERFATWLRLRSKTSWVLSALKTVIAMSKYTPRHSPRRELMTARNFVRIDHFTILYLFAFLDFSVVARRV
ncbi:MAG: hypothetical protein HC902_13910 [Calothrix sp. SM1_5_4]|nr:hypothetical protein [Calothrix sp. SM1_5_4]